MSEGQGLASPLAPGAEFDAIRALVARWGVAARGIGDDTATIDVPAGERLVTSTDTSVEDVHFRRDWLTPEEIGWRAAAAALSDLAAAAAKPLGVLLALTVPPGWRDALPALGDGLGAAAREVGAPILGGDLSSGRELSITCTVFGSAVAPLGRAGVRPGDRLWVTGALGGPAAAVRAWRRGATPEPGDRARFARPHPRLAEARWFADRGARAAIDISDGLAADLAHLAAASGVHITIALDRVPCVAGVTPRDAAASGEEYEIAVALPQDAAIDSSEFRERFGLTVTALGEAAAGEPGVEVRERGARVEFPRGYDHFSP